MDILGKFLKLTVASNSELGTFLQVGREEILLPKSIARKKYVKGETAEVFIYRDAEGRLIAIDAKPYAQINECAYMKVKQNTSFGSFVDNGIPKDLLVPFSEQKVDLEEGRSYPVFVMVDEKSNKLIGSTRLNDFISNEEIEVEKGEEVKLLITDKTDLGFKVIINDKHWGLLYQNEIFKPVRSGDKLTGYIKEIRPDNKIDISLQKQGYDEVSSASDIIMKKLKENKGTLRLHDKSDPDEIYHTLGISKKVFKKAIGLLYKQRRIEITESGIRSVEDEEF